MPVAIPDSVLKWLLEADNQPVRYLTLTDLLGRAQSDPEAAAAKAACGEYAPTKAILSHYGQFRDDDKDAAYQKYGGRYWQIIFLGQFRADPDDERVRELAERLIAGADWRLIPHGGQCLTANLLSALAHLGYADHPAVTEAAIGMAERIVRDKGIDCEVMEYSLLTRCYMAQPKLLLCFGGNDAVRNHPAVVKAIDLISKNMTKHRINVYVPGNKDKWLAVLAKKPDKAKLKGMTVRSWMRDRKKKFLSETGPGEPTAKPGWLKPGFPLHYNSDLLEALYAMALCGVPADGKLDGPLDILRGKLTGDGRLVMENSLNGKMRADVEEVGKPSKWLTYRAWRVLTHFGR